MSEELLDAANEAFLNVMKGAGHPKYTDITTDSLKQDTLDRFEQSRLQLIDVPTVKWWQRRVLSIFGLPLASEQLRDMWQIVSDKAPSNWSYTGSAMDVPDPQLDKCLGKHPHELLAHGLNQIAQSSFAPEHWVEFPTYFEDPNLEGGTDTRRIFQVFVFYVYLNGTESQAKSISSILRVCDELKSLRAEISAAKTLYKKQSSELQNYFEALHEHVQSGQSTKRPHWKEFLKD